MSISFVNFHSIHSSYHIIKAVQGNSCWTDTGQTWTESFWCVPFFNYGRHLYSMLGIYCSKASKIESRRGVCIIFNYNILNDDYRLFSLNDSKNSFKVNQCQVSTNCLSAGQPPVLFQIWTHQTRSSYKSLFWKAVKHHFFLQSEQLAVRCSVNHRRDTHSGKGCVLCTCSTHV